MNRSSIDQFSPSIREHDAIGNEVLALQKLFTNLGGSSRLFAEEEGTAAGQHVHRWQGYTGSAGDILVIHYSYGSPAYAELCSGPQRKLLLYHVPTPPDYLKGLHRRVGSTALQAIDELPRYTEKIDIAVAHSRFAASELQAAGYDRVEIVPYLLSERLYQIPPDREILGNFEKDGRRNLLVVGRVAPNKRIEDCLFVFDYLKRYVDARWRLFLVGSSAGAESYRKRLEKLIGQMELTDVDFTGPVSQSTLMAYYQIADAYLCMSGHEGFGVPLVEAMRMDLPVFAFAAGSVPEVLGDSGVLFETRNWPLIAETIASVVSEDRRRSAVLSRQRRRRESFAVGATEKRWKKLIEQCLAIETGRG